MLKKMFRIQFIAPVSFVGLCDTSGACHDPRRARQTANQQCVPVQDSSCGSMNSSGFDYSTNEYGSPCSQYSGSDVYTPFNYSHTNYQNTRLHGSSSTIHSSQGYVHANVGGNSVNTGVNVGQ